MSFDMKIVASRNAIYRCILIFNGFILTGCMSLNRAQDFNGDKDQLFKGLDRAFDIAAEQFGVKIDSDSMVTSMHNSGHIVVATISSTPIADALIYFSFPNSRCGSNALESGFYKIETVEDDKTGTLAGVRHLDANGREVITIPLDQTKSHSHHHTTGSMIVTGSEQDTNAAVSVFAWYNTGKGNTHIEYDLTNGQCCPLPGC